MAKRKEPCSFCADDIIESITGTNGFQGAVEWYPENGLFSVVAFANDENGEPQEYELVNQTVNYCPVCGRKLDF